MKHAGEHRFESPRERVWEALLDADTLSRCLPGFERLERVADNEYEGALDIRVGPVQGKFQGRLTLSELDPPSGYRMAIKGQGPPGFVDGRGMLELEAQGEATLLRYDMDAQVGGKIAGVGQRLLDSSAKALTQQALTELAKQIAGPSGDSEATADADAPAAPSQAEFAAKVAKGVADDLIPRERRPLLLAAALVVLGAVVVVVLRACGG